MSNKRKAAKKVHCFLCGVERLLEVYKEDLEEDAMVEKQSLERALIACRNELHTLGYSLCDGCVKVKNIRTHICSGCKFCMGCCRCLRCTECENTPIRVSCDTCTKFICRTCDPDHKTKCKEVNK